MNAETPMIAFDDYDLSRLCQMLYFIDAMKQISNHDIEFHATAVNGLAAPAAECASAFVAEIRKRIDEAKKRDGGAQ
jgi:hypothetical protein